MGEATFWGFVAGSSLVFGSLLTLAVRPSQRANGLVMAFGAGVLISAIAYELVRRGRHRSRRRERPAELVAVGLGLGAMTFYLGDLLIDRAGGEHRKSSTGAQADGSSLAIALGALLDGVPESIVLGLSLLLGDGISVALLAAVFISNFPEAVAATSGLSRSGWSNRRILGMWTAIAVVSGLAAGLGYLVFSVAADLTGAFAPGLRGGSHADRARRHDDARGVPLRRPQDGALHGARLRGRGLAQLARVTAARRGHEGARAHPGG